VEANALLMKGQLAEAVRVAEALRTFPDRYGQSRAEAKDTVDRGVGELDL
jgi:hypothetical protein